MKKENFPFKLYETSAAQDMILYMLRYCPYKQVVQIPTAITVGRSYDFELMKKAVDIEIARNDCLRLRFVKKGFKYRQYFLPEYHIANIPVIHFHSKQQQTQYFTANAQNALAFMKGELFRVVLFENAEGKQGIFLNVNHLVMDMAAVFIFYNDLLAVYDALEAEKDLPKPMGSFEVALQKELELKAHPTYYDNEEKLLFERLSKYGRTNYLDVHGFERLEKARKLMHRSNCAVTSCYNPLFSESHSSRMTASKEDSDIIFRYINETGISPEVLVQTALHIHLSDINDDMTDHCLFTLCTRRNNRNTKQCGGTMTSALLWRTDIPNTSTAKEATDNIGEIQKWFFRHQDYPFVRAHFLMLKVSPFTLLGHPSTGMFSWFALNGKSMNNWDYTFKSYNMGHYCMPFYAMASKDYRNGCFEMAFIYRTHYINDEDVENLFKRTVKILIIIAQEPELTIKQIKVKLREELPCSKKSKTLSLTSV